MDTIILKCIDRTSASLLYRGRDKEKNLGTIHFNQIALDALVECLSGGRKTEFEIEDIHNAFYRRPVNERRGSSTVSRRDD